MVHLSVMPRIFGVSLVPCSILPSLVQTSPTLSSRSASTCMTPGSLTLQL
uniref:Uncharacterized protein n=1 Tax=Arundo donax TaxID=35708 RepID=A0A0A8ZY89_ARUDO